MSFIYNFNSNFLDVLNTFFYKKSLFVYQGHHFGYLANFANICLPVRFFYEKSFIYINLFGLLNNFIYSTYRFFVNYIKTDLKVLLLLFEIINLYAIKVYLTFETSVNNIKEKITNSSLAI